MQCKILFFLPLILLLAEKIFAEIQDVPNNEIHPDQDSEGDRGKRHVGRWKNFRHKADASIDNGDDARMADEKRHIGRWKNLNWKLDADKRFFGRWRDLSQSLPNANDVDKRHIGRWKNINYLNNLRNGNIDDNEKRFFGRWRDINYLLGSDNEKRNGKSMTEANGVPIPVDANLMSELGDINAMDKRHIGRWKNINYRLNKHD